MPKRTSPQRRPAVTHHDTPARREAPESRSLLARILETPHLAHVVPRLPPDVLHRVIQTCGLEDCGEIVALATPGQLAHVFDLDLWKSAQPGVDEQFDADRFGVWLEVMMESGAASAARTLSGVDIDLAISAFAHHVRVFDPGTFLPTAPSDDEMPDLKPAHDGLSGDIGGYLVLGTHTESWDAIVSVLCALDAHHHAYFQRLMGGCRDLSNAGRELDGLDDLLEDQEQAMFDVAFTRERRRDQQGYLTPAQARAFLQMSRAGRPGHDTSTSANPIVRAYFDSLESMPPPHDDGASRRLLTAGDAPLAAAESADAVTAFAEVLRDAGILAEPPRALLDGAQGPAPRLSRMQTLMQIAAERDPVAFSTRGQELAFLANAIAAGCSMQARPFTAEEASGAAVATCNLGLAAWRSGAPPPDAFLVDHDLIGVFQAGWTVLYEDVCMAAAKQLIAVLKQLRCEDRETQAGLNALRVAMTKQWKAGTPWLAREALDVITALDMPAWAALLGVIDECPVMHAGVAVTPGSAVRQVNATDVAFISEPDQVASIHAFMRALPGILGR